MRGQGRCGRCHLAALLRATLRAAILAALSGTAFAGEIRAEGLPLAPNTKVRVSVVHWSPTEGEYRTWDAIGGEFLISQEGTVVLPIVGAIAASTMDTGALASDVASRLQAATGLVAKPDVTVEVVKYPSVFVLGAVSEPGQYEFSVGLTVLQAVAMAGGPAKPDVEHSKEQLEIVGRLRAVEGGMLLSKARLARLEAELAGSTTIAFPDSAEGGSGSAAEEVYERERAIFAARAKEQERQTANLTELRSLFQAEIEVIEQKRSASDQSIRTTEEQLTAIKSLVEKGVVVLQRQIDLERELSDLRSERLDQITAIMRARQNMAEASRSIDGLRDQRRTEVATFLQTERASLRQAEIAREIDQKRLLELLANDPGRIASGGEGSATYLISRSENGRQTEIEATESAVLKPGDVVTIKPVAVPPSPVGDTTAIAPIVARPPSHPLTLAVR